jgi:hypothetical protein
VAVGYLLAALAKEAAVTLPFALAAILAIRYPDLGRIDWSKQAALFMTTLIVAGAIFLVRTMCLGASVGVYPSGRSPADPVSILALPRFLLFLLFPAPLPGTQPFPVTLRWMAAISALVPLAILFSTRVYRVAGLAIAAIVALALPVLAISQDVAGPADTGRIFLLPVVGFALLIGYLFRDLRPVIARVGLAVMLTTWGALAAYYQYPWLIKAIVVRRVLRQIEEIAHATGTSRVVVANLPDDYFGPENMYLPMAARPPFVDLPPYVKVTGQREGIDRPDRSAVVLVWNPETKRLHPGVEASGR